MSVVLEPMAGRHVDAVCAIDSRCFSRPWSAAQWRTELTAADRTHLVARDSDQVSLMPARCACSMSFTSRPLPSTPTMKARATAPASVSSCCASALPPAPPRRPSRCAPRRTAPSGSMAASGLRLPEFEPLLRPSHRRRRHHVAPRSRLAGDRRAARSGRRRTPPDLRRSRLMTADRILGIETSCDETAAAVVRQGTDVMSSVVSSQIEIHQRYGGVVPRSPAVPMSSRSCRSSPSRSSRPAEDHEVDAIAATHGPGLVGALLVGVSAAKAMSLVWDVPFIAMNHLESHLYAAFLEEPDLEMPLVVLLVSGGHTMLIVMEDHLRYRVLGSTLDDAAGRRSTRSRGSWISATPAGRWSTGWRSTATPPQSGSLGQWPTTAGISRSRASRRRS